MAEIDTLNIGGIDYAIKDSVARSSSGAANLIAYTENGTTASQAYSVIGTPINWKGTLYYTKTAVAKGATWAVDTNLTAANNLGKLTRNIKTYVGSDGKLHFTDLTGADTVLNFKPAECESASYWTEQNWHTSDQDRMIQWYYVGQTGTMTSKTATSLGGQYLECNLCRFGINSSGQHYITAKKACKVYDAANTLKATLSANQTATLSNFTESGAGFYVIKT